MGSKSAHKQTIETSFKLILNSALNVENMLLMSDDPSSRLPQTAALLHGRWGRSAWPFNLEYKSEV